MHCEAVENDSKRDPLSLSLLRGREGGEGDGEREGDK
jgi:hypothetical protein